MKQWIYVIVYLKSIGITQHTENEKKKPTHKKCACRRKLKHWGAQHLTDPTLIQNRKTQSSLTSSGYN